MAGVVDRALHSHLLSSGFTFGWQVKSLAFRVRAGGDGAMPCCCNSYRGLVTHTKLVLKIQGLFTKVCAVIS